MSVGKLSGKAQQAYRLSDARLNLYEGSVRSSKTITSLLAWCRFVMRCPPGNLLMAGKTERTLKRNVIAPLTEMLGDKRCRLVAGSGELHLLGRLVYLVGANDERSESKIRGLSLVGGYADEISTLPETFFSMLLSRLSEPGAALFGTSNPEGPQHWLLRDYLARSSLWVKGDGTIETAEHGDDDDDDAALDLARFSFRLADNPFLSPDYVSSLSREYRGLWRKRYIDGLWVAAAGAIYDMWDPDLHVVDVLPPMRAHLCCSIDYGTSHPLAAVLLSLGVDGRLYVISEYRYDSKAQRRQLTDTEYSERIRLWLNTVQIPGTKLLGVRPSWMVVDPSAASFKVQLHRDGFEVTDADNTVLDGIRLVSSLITSRQLLVHRSCKALIDEFPSYVWDPRATALGEDKPVKAGDDQVDALRYAVMTTRTLWQHRLRAAA